MYPTMVFLHVLGAIVFALGHGTSIAVAFRLRKEHEHPRIAAMLDVSSWSAGLMYLGLLLIVAPGIILGFLGGYWGTWWLWISIALLVIVLGAMYGLASPYYRDLRAVTGATLRRPAQKMAIAPAPDVVTSLATSSRPIALALIGGVGLLVILWLMIVQPG